LPAEVWTSGSSEALPLELPGSGNGSVAAVMARHCSDRPRHGPASCR
jgi:hypothetical protein